MKIQHIKWVYLAILSLVWGSSYILIKWGLVALSPLQLGSLRLLITTIALLLVGYSSLQGLSRYHWKWLAITGYVGTFFPAFLFAFAQQHIDSAIAAILNALTPLLTIIFGLLFFKIDILKKQYFGVGIGLAWVYRFGLGGSSNRIQYQSNLHPVDFSGFLLLCDEYPLYKDPLGTSWGNGHYIGEFCFYGTCSIRRAYLF